MNNIFKLKSKLLSVKKYILGFLLLYFLLAAVGVYMSSDISKIGLPDTKRAVIASFLVVLHSVLYKYKRDYFIFILGLSSLFLSIIGIKIFTDEYLHIKEIFKFMSFSLAIINVYILIMFIEFNKIAKIVFSSIFLLIIYLPICVYWEYYFISGSFYNADTILAIMQTNRSEAIEYIATNASAAGYVLLGVFIAIALIVSLYAAKSLIRTNQFTWRSSAGVLAVVLFITDIFMICKYRENILTAPFYNAQLYIKTYQNFEKQKKQRQSSIIDNLSITPPYVSNINNKGIYVLVIGESQNKNHMSAYGYNRNTTPWLDSMKNNANLLFFKNAYANQVHTVPALTYALTAKNQYNDIDLADAWSLLEVAEAAGYDTAWISNQVKYGVYDTPITVIASDAKQQEWINKTTGEISKVGYYDEKIVDAIDQINFSDKMLIVIHLMGNHIAYDQRYSNNFAEYTSDSNIDKYDNSMLYNDFVVKKIYEKVKGMPNFKGLVYFADHADAVDQGLAHDSSNFVPDMAKIPFYIYLSDSYIQEHPHVFSLLKSEQDYYFTNDLIYNTMLGLMQIRTKELYEPQNDLTSGEYNNDLSRFKTLHGAKYIADFK